MLELEGKTAVVIGAASGIGRATVELYAELGVPVLCADLNGDGAEAVASAIRASGADARSFQVDTADEGQVSAMVDAAVEAWGQLDILVNCAQAAGETAMRDGAVGDMDLDLWEKSFAVLARGPMLGCKHAVRVMLPRGTGSIVNVSSSHSLIGELGQTAYGAAKGAVNSLTRYVATQYGKAGIRCNTVVPGPTLTPALVDNTSEELRQMLMDSALTPYLGEPQDLARSIVFVSSPWARYITGEIICANGGRTVHAATYAQELASEGEHA
jgi:NAD(P)-dependent dehydrogenase (short-subunit alcohol dehydrogenase family)